MVKIVRTHTKVKIEDTDGIDFLHFLISLAQRDMFGNGFGYTVKNAFEIMNFASVLDFDDDDLTFTIQRLDIDTIKLVIDTFLVTFAFENFENTDLFPQHDSQETVKHIEVGLLTQQTFDGPIKADIPILQFFSFILCHGF